MASELLTHGPELLEIFLSVPVLAISLSLRRQVKEERTDVPKGKRLEIDHIVPHFAGGNGDRENLRAVTLPEHAERHLKDALKSKDKDEASSHFWSTSAIVARMTESELREFNRKLRKR